MYIKYAKDYYSGKILGVAVAVATNCVGYAVANPKMKVDKEAKKDLVAFAINKAMSFTPNQNIKSLAKMIHPKEYSESNILFNDRIHAVIDAFTDVAYKASVSRTLPTMILPGENQ